MDQLIKKLRKVDELYRIHRVINISDKFINDNTRFTSIRDLIKECGIEPESAIVADVYRLNEFIKQNTKYKSLIELMMLEIVETVFNEED